MAQSTAVSRRTPTLASWATVLGVLAIVLAYGALTLGRDFVDVWVEEDGPVEWVGAVGLFVGSGLFLASFLVARRRGVEAVNLSRLGVWFLLVLALGLFVAGGEEISWGQRLFGFATPEAMEHMNAQGETTLHNLTPLQSGVFDGDRLFRLAWMGLFVVLPVVAALWQPARDRLVRLVPLVPLRLSLLFVLAWVLASAVMALVGHYDSIYPIRHGVTEVQEAIAEVLSGVAALLTLLRLRSMPSALDGTVSP